MIEDAQAPEHAAAGHATVPEQRSLIELAGVARRYDMGEVTVTALEDVDLRIERGDSSSSSVRRGAARRRC